MIMKSTSWASVRGPRCLTIFASKLSGCAGMHGFMSPRDMALEFRQQRGAECDIPLVPVDFLPVAQAATRTLAALAYSEPTVRQRVHDAMTATYADAECVSRAVAAVSEFASAEVTEVVRSALFTANGTSSEEGIREATVADGTSSIRGGIRTDAGWHQCGEPWMRVGQVDVYVGGRHDGIDGGGGIVEFKARQHRLMGVRLYERVQCHAYMHIFGVRRSTLVESYMGDRREHEVLFDDVFWEKVTVATRGFLAPLLLVLPHDVSSCDPLARG